MTTAHLLTNPLCHPKDLGKPLPPDDSHATSVVIPTWADAFSYGQNRAELKKKLQSDYPRFSLHPLVKKLFDRYQKKFAEKGEALIAFPSEQVALRAKEFILEQTEKEAKLHDTQEQGIFALTFPSECFEAAFMYWRYSGEIISSHFAEALLTGNTDEKKNVGQQAKKNIRQRIADYTDEPLQNIVLFPTGKAAVFTTYRFLQISFPDRPSIHLGISTMDTLTAQQKFGESTYSFAHGDEDDLKGVEELLEKEKILGIFCELPAHFQQKSLNLQRLRILSKKYNVPIIIDDTVGTFHNKAAFEFADIVISSLSKFFSGTGNVCGGALILNKDSRFKNVFARVFQSNFEDLLWTDDAILLEKNSEDFIERMKKVDATAQKLTQFLKGHEAVYRVVLPKFEGNGGGTLEFRRVFSFLLCNPQKNTPLFFDALKVCKGPNFGMNWTMMFPHLATAKKEDQEFAQKQGVSPYLLRVSVGLEDADDLIERFRKAFEEMKNPEGRKSVSK